MADFFENLFVDRVPGMIGEILGRACRSKKDDSGQPLCRIMPEQVADTIETSSREGISC